MPTLSDRHHDAFDNPAKAACREDNLRGLREAAYLARRRAGKMNREQGVETLLGLATQPARHERFTMPTITIEDAQAKLPEILANLSPGDQVAIVQAGEEIARLTRSSRTQWPCQAGSYRKTEFWMAPDFDAPLDEFKEYME